MWRARPAIGPVLLCHGLDTIAPISLLPIKKALSDKTKQGLHRPSCAEFDTYHVMRVWKQ